MIENFVKIGVKLGILFNTQLVQISRGISFYVNNTLT